MMPLRTVATGFVRRLTGGISCATFLCAASLAAQHTAADAKETPEAKQWLDRAVQAAGGPSVVYGCRTLIVSGKSKRAIGDARLDVDTTTYFSYPLSVRQEIVTAGTRLAMVSTPEEAFLVTDQGPVLLNEIARRSIELPAMRNPVSLLKSRGSLYFGARLQGTGKVDGRDVGFLEVRMAEHVTTIAISAETGRIVQETYRGYEGADGGGNATFVVRFDDFRALPSGLVYPYRSRVESNGAFESESIVKDLRINDPIDPSLFVSGLTRPKAAAGLPQQKQFQ